MPNKTPSHLTQKVQGSQVIFALHLSMGSSWLTLLEILHGSG